MSIKDQIVSNLEQIRPALQRDGGDVEYVDYDVDSGILKVRLMGTCRGCPYSQMTLSNGIKARLQQNFPDLKDVVSV
ncbi:MAG: NifU family protein [Candidatus Hodarchaeales archaeon]|jgi:Fe-S cluster biogenesis protein NfuA